MDEKEKDESIKPEAKLGRSKSFKEKFWKIAPRPPQLSRSKSHTDVLDEGQEDAVNDDEKNTIEKSLSDASVRRKEKKRDENGKKIRKEKKEKLGSGPSSGTASTSETPPSKRKANPKKKDGTKREGSSRGVERTKEKEKDGERKEGGKHSEERRPSKRDIERTSDKKESKRDIERSEKKESSGGKEKVLSERKELSKRDVERPKRESSKRDGIKKDGEKKEGTKKDSAREGIKKESSRKEVEKKEKKEENLPIMKVEPPKSPPKSKRHDKRDRDRGEKKRKEGEEQGKEELKDQSMYLCLDEILNEDDEKKRRSIAQSIPSISRLKRLTSNETDDESDDPLDTEVGTPLSMSGRLSISSLSAGKWNQGGSVHASKSQEFISPLSADRSRVVNDVAKPVSERLPCNMIISSSNPPRVAVRMVMSHLRREGRLSIEAALYLVNTAKEIFRKEPNVLDLSAPVNVYGDIHGQFYDLLNILEKSGYPPEKKCLFLGDYVDRGMFGTEVVFFLLALKITYPRMIWMLRGNHESRKITNNFNFKTEVFVKYNEEVYDAIMECFDTLPVAATVKTQFGVFFCVHGGIGPDTLTVSDINQVDRFGEVEYKGPICSLLWSDPINAEEYPDMSPQDLRSFFFRHNEGRGGVGWLFGARATKSFLARNGFISIVRAHEVQQFGIAEHSFGISSNDFPLCITLFSAPNYCEMYDNKAAWLILSESEMDYEVIDHVPHPYILPNFMNAIQFSLPYVGEFLARVTFQFASQLFSNEEVGEELDEATEKTMAELFESSRKMVKAMQKRKEMQVSLMRTNIPEAFVEDMKKHGVKSKFGIVRKFDKGIEVSKMGNLAVRRVKSTPF